MTYPMSTDPRAAAPSEDRIKSALLARGVLALQIDRIVCVPVTDMPGCSHLCMVTVHGAPDWECWLNKDGTIASLNPVEVPA